MIIVIIIYQGKGLPTGWSALGNRSAGYLDVLQLLIIWKPIY